MEKKVKLTRDEMGRILYVALILQGRLGGGSGANCHFYNDTDGRVACEVTEFFEEPPSSFKTVKESTVH